MITHCAVIFYTQLMRELHPTILCFFKHAIELHKLYKIQPPPLDWIALNFDQTISRRQTHFTISSSGNYKVGNNILSNRLSILNNKIELAWLNQSLSAFKIKAVKICG